MARGKKYHVKFVIEANGLTTNNFMVDLIDKVLFSMVNYMNITYKQSTVTLRRCLDDNTLNKVEKSKSNS